MTKLKGRLAPHWTVYYKPLLIIACIYWFLLSSVQAEIIPNIVGKTLDKKITSLHRTLSGKPTVVNFWWVKCSPCKKELPDLIKKSKAYPDVDFIYIHAQTNSATKSLYDAATVSQFLSSQGISLEKVIIANTKSRQSVGVEALPTTLLVNRFGRIEKNLVGFTPQNTASISEWLKAQK